MALVKTPSPQPTALDYVPPNSEPANVGAKDSWWTLAERQGSKAAGLSALDLCYFNFGKRKASEINWYLKHKVGCTMQTRDGDNYTFAACKFPNKVYIPKIGVIPPRKEYPNFVEDTLWFMAPWRPYESPYESTAWLGIGVKGGGHLAIFGFDTMLGKVWSIDATGRSFGLMAETIRGGPGLGGGGNVCIVYVTGYANHQMSPA